MILYETPGKFGWYVAIGRKDTGIFGFHVGFCDAPIFSLNLFVLCISYWDYPPKWLDWFTKQIGKDWRSES